MLSEAERTAIVSYWPFWMFIIGIVVVVGAVLTWAWLTVEREPRGAPAHGIRTETLLERWHRKIYTRHNSRRAVTRRSLRRSVWKGRRSRVRTRLFTGWMTLSSLRADLRIWWIKRATPKPPAPAPEKSPAARADDEEDPGWAAQLRQDIKDEDAAKDAPNAHLQRAWSEGDDTGTFRKDMLARMIADGQMPPEENDKTH